MRTITLAATLAALAALTTGTARASIVYTLNTTITSATPTGNPAQTDTVSGSITTDGTIGVIQTGNILTYNLALIDQLNPASNYTLTPTNSTIVEDTGSALSASASALSFDFSGSGEFLIQANSPGPFTGSHYFCFSTGSACAPGETISPGFVFTDGVTTTGSAVPVGAQPIGTPPSPTAPSSVPEPATISLVLAGLASASFMRKRRRVA